MNTKLLQFQGTMDESYKTERLPRFIKLKDESGAESIHYNTVSKECPKEVEVYAEKELNETEESKRRGIEKLRTYMKKENLPDLEDTLLVAVLRCCKYNIKKSEVKLKKFFNVRHMIIKNLKKIEDEKVEHLLTDGFSECLPWADKQGRPIYIFRPKMNLDVYDYQEMAAYAQSCLFSVLTYPLPTIKGVALIIDCNVKSPSMILQMMNEYRKYIGLEKTVPLRVGRIDFVNENVVAHYVYALIRPFLPSKIVNRIAFHGSDLTKLHKIYHPDLLPDDFGGNLGPVDTKLFKEEKLRTIKKLKAVNFF